MIRKLAHISLSVWLTMLLLFGDTSKEFIHSFTQHKDTVEHSYDGVAFEKEHHHCDFLNFSLTEFANDLQFPVIIANPVKYFVSWSSPFIGDYYYIPVVSSLRGPPAMV